MGDMADMQIAQMWDFDEGSEEPEVLVLFALPAPDLIKATSLARDEKVVGIRRYYAEHGKLSEKQRWCLAFWAAEHCA